MSYDIIYRKAFIKVGEGKAINFFESGSNNLYDHNNKRSRGWWVSQLFGERVITEELVLDWVKNENARLTEENPIGSEDAYDQKYWGWYSAISLGSKGTSGTSLSAFKSWFINGIKGALTIEEYKEQDVSFEFYLPYGLDKEKIEGLPKFVPIGSTDFLIEKMDEMFSLGYNIKVYGIDRYFDNLKIKNRIARQARPKTNFNELPEYFVLNMGWGYVSRVTRRNMQYFPDVNGWVKKFKTEKEAQKYLDKIKPRFNCIFKIEKMVNKAV